MQLVLPEKRMRLLVEMVILSFQSMQLATMPEALSGLSVVLVALEVSTQPAPADLSKSL